MERVRIGIVHYPGVQLSAALGLADLFGVANHVASGRDVAVPLLEVRPQSCDADGWPDPGPDTARLDVVILPPSLGGVPAPGAVPGLTDWLRSHHAAGCVLASVCVGAFLLAETGLLDGRRATTHWAYAAAMGERYPRLSLDPDRLIVDDGDIVTAGGLMSWADLGLHLVDRFLGSTVMLETSRVLLLDPPGREQRFYNAFVLRLNHGDPAILKVQHWMQTAEGRDAPLAALAGHAGLEPRTFLRRFRKATGVTSTDYAQRLRTNRARELLQFSQMTVDAVAWEVGYQDPAAFRKVFHRVVGLTPSEFRQRFRA
ncbi:GlxA family transcriptional regulator [Roseicyclus persicicus]|uniref:GlxA family transcriptional regulator n=1 Tax=Roseicyclus persicicus TaxID=2650661 RepID=A0A7X6JYZ5_9RHOB|nr:GlxA family transcriptional regulator [Roseibacterium persicicum]NKX44620.1 GlxA family transcriptional regulator [Roseibacterium persicicum]